MQARVMAAHTQYMAPESDPVAQESVVLASFENRHAAERMMASLGRGFRKEARKGDVAAFVVSGNKDGSLEVTQSRVLSAAGIVYTISRIALVVSVGLMGLLSTLKGARGAVHEVRAHQGHVGSDAEQVHEVLAQVGPGAAIALICCSDPETRAKVVAQAADRAVQSWDGSRAEALAHLDPGSKHDWVRAALGEPSSTKS